MVARKHDHEDGRQAALEPAGCADADQSPHHQPEIEAAGVNEHAFEDIRRTTQMCTAHTTGVVRVREAALDAFAAPSQQPFASIAANATTIAVDGIARIVFDPSTIAGAGRAH